MKKSRKTATRQDKRDFYRRDVKVRDKKGQEQTDRHRDN